MTPGIQRRAGYRSAKEGFTLVELSIAIAIMMIGLVSVVASTSRMHLLRKQNRELTLANNGVRTMAERIHASSHGFSDDPGTWASELIARFSAGGSFGGTFEVRGLEPVTGAPAVGTITFITDETATDAALSTTLGMPRDLDGDGATTNADVSTTARILPVVLTLRWRSMADVNEVTHEFFVLGY